MHIVVTHDFAETFGGAERVTREMALEFPDAPVWGILGRAEVLERMGVRERWHSVLPARHGLLRNYRLITPLYPLLVQRALLPEADVLLTSSYAFAHHFRTPNGAPQVCYCHSPLRFAWSMTSDYRKVWAGSPAAGPVFEAMAGWMRNADRRAASRVSVYLTQSAYVAGQIERSYSRPAKVIGAPVDCARFHPGPPGRRDDYFLFCGRLIEPYKKASLAIEAFRQLPHRLMVAGDGPALPELRRTAPPNVEFVGHLDDDDLVPLMQDCAAVVFPSRDDFGLIPLEAMACGRPVLAFAGGGAAQTVQAGVTGELFPEQTVAALVSAVRRFDAAAYDAARIRAHAEQWDRSVFRRRLRETVKAMVR